MFQRYCLPGQFVNDIAKELRVEYSGGLAEGAKGSAVDTKLLLHFFETCGLLQTAETAEDRVEKVEQDQRNVLVEEEQAVVGSVSGSADGLESFEKWLQQPKVL